MAMRIEIIDERDEDLKYLGFMSIDDEEKHLHCSVQIYSNTVYFQDFMSGYIGKYTFQANRSFTDYKEHNGVSFQGAGRGRKPDKAWQDMKELIYKAKDLELVLDDEHKVGKNKYLYEL